MLNLYQCKADGASLFNEERFVLVQMIFMRLHAVWFLSSCLFFVFFPFSFLHSAFVWHVVDILTSQPVHFLFYRFCLFLSHFMCQNESRAYSLLNSNIPTVTNSSQERSLSLHMALNISELFGFSFVFWLQGRPTVKFCAFTLQTKHPQGEIICCQMSSVSFKVLIQIS